MRKYKVILTAVALSALVLTGCKSSASNGYPAATHAYNVAGTAYKTAVDKIQSLRTLGEVSDADFTLAIQFTANERSWASVVDKDLAAWQATGMEPVTYQSDFKALQSAQAAVIALAGRL